MRRILVCSGALGRTRGLEWLKEAVDLRKPDGVFFAGGILDAIRQHLTTPPNQLALARNEAQFVRQFFDVLGKLGVFTAIIPGPGDTPLEEVLRLGMNAEVEYPGLHLVHAGLVTKGELAVCGLGGHIHENDTWAWDQNSYSRTMAEFHLRSLWSAKQPHRVMLLATPPNGVLGGEEGKALAGELIDSLHPSLCVVAGPNERRGFEWIASTLMINPGQLANGWAAWVDWNKPRQERVEFLHLRDLELTAVGADTGVCD